ncbi:MAG: cobalt ECF transporter T component CbiQ [Actinomycetota bacterium]|nr:cobalt ECF transporter T component CbiQ [Actinomycetota bacterium]
MSGGHAHGLFFHKDSLVHRLPPHCKIVATLFFVLSVMTVPREAVWAFGLFGVLLGAVAIVARIPLKFMAPKLAIELPFIGFALLLPFVAAGRRVDVIGLSLSVEGLWAGFNIFAKATLGLGATLILLGTTEVADLLRGLDRMRVPRVITAIAGFMVRYADVVTGEMRRMRIARESRSYNPKALWRTRALASTAGTMFIRSYERGERVHTAMLARGYAGSMPQLRSVRPTWKDWLISLSAPATAATIAFGAWGGYG